MKYFLKEIWIIIIFICINFSCIAQPSWLRGNFGSGWSDYLMIDRGVIKSVTLQATATNATAAFFYSRDLGYSPKWCGSNIDYSRSVNQLLYNSSYYYTSGGWDHDLNVAVTSGKYYTFITSKNTASNNNIAILETTFQPVSIVSASRLPSGNPAQNVPVVVTAKLNAIKDVSEKVFLRWTKDNWATSSFEEITSINTNNEGSATIMGLPAGTNVSYYLLTSTQSVPVDSTIDYYSLNLNNNSNANYGYTVVAFSGCPFFFDLGNDTSLCGGAAFILDPGITVSPFGDSLTILYDATKGQSGLAGASKVYMHASAELHANGGWQYVTGNWGLDDGLGKMTNIGADLWQIKINPVTYFGYPYDSTLNSILMVFRNSDGTLTGKDYTGNDIIVNMKSTPVVSSFNGVSPFFLQNLYDSITWSNGSHAQTLVISSSGSYYATITNSNGGCFASDTINVSVNSIPYVNIGNDQELCNGDSIILNAGNSFYSYSWSTGATTQSIKVKTSGQYSVTVTNSSGCSGFDFINVNFIDAPVADFYYTINGMTVNFSDSSVNAVNYKWDFNGNGIAESTIAGNVSYTYTAPGQYNCSLIVSNNCSSDTIHKLIIVTGNGIEENPNISSFNVFPNPANKLLTLSFESLIISDWKLDITGILGQSVVSESINNFKGNFIKSFDVSELPKGLYLIRLYNDHEKINKLIVIE